MNKLKNLKSKKLLNNKLSLKEQLSLLDNINTFLQRGFSLTDTLSLLKYRYHLDDYIEELEEGHYVSEILTKRKFDSDVLLVVEIAEYSGNLKMGINNACEVLKQKINNKSEIMKQMKYPILLMAITIFALGFVSIFLIPQFRSIYESFGAVSPSVNMLFNIINFLPLVLSVICLIVVLIISLIHKLPENKKLNVFLTNKFIRKTYLRMYNHLFTINLVSLLKSGLKVDEIFLVLSKQKHNLLLYKESNKILTLLERGESLDKCLTPTFYDRELITLIKEGEIFSNLLHNLENYMIFLQQKSNQKTKKLFFLIQPIFYGLFGILIVMLYSTIFIPMFQIMDNF